jgi:hypothetical protein
MPALPGAALLAAREISAFAFSSGFNYFCLPSMPIRLLALDLDGTLFNSHGQLTTGNSKAIAAARERGVRVAVVTGRRFRDARPIALELGLDAPLIAHNGALTKHARTLETVAVLPLPRAAALRALAIGRRAGADPLLSDDHEGLGILLYDRVGANNPTLLKYIAWARRIHGDEGANAVRESASLEDYLDHDPLHLTFSGDCAARVSLTRCCGTSLARRQKSLVRCIRSSISRCSTWFIPKRQRAWALPPPPTS